MFSSTAPDMGTQVFLLTLSPYMHHNPVLQGILDRYTQIKPKLFFAETEVFYAGKTTNLLPRVSEVAQKLSSMGLRKVILLPSSKSGKDLPLSSNLKVPNG